MSLTARDIAEITRLLEESAFDELELEINGMKIHLKRDGASTPTPTPTPTPVPAPLRDAASVQPAAQCLAAPGTPRDPHCSAVRAPLLGTFYRAPKPGVPPFVEVGAEVEPDTIIGIIEVMKLMNTVRAGMRGRVHEILARDGVLVEFGEILLLVDTRETR